MLVIVLATCNGRDYLREQIESIRAQTIEEWTLLVSDDRSCDDTLDLLEDFASCDRRIELLPQPAERLGPARNFARLLEQAHRKGAGYVAFCDQDDVWFPDKLERQLERMRVVQVAAGQDVPILVHSDAEVVDKTLRHICGSRH